MLRILLKSSIYVRQTFLANHKVNRTAEFFTRTMSSHNPHILTNINNGLQIITFNRPSKKNAITPQMYQTLIDVINESSMNKNVSALVFTGKGEFYSSGNDMQLGADVDSGGSKSITNLVKIFTDALILYPKLLIAVLNGPAIGIAMTTLGLFDIIYASDKAYFQTPFSKIGFTAEGCSTYTFPKIFGTSKASEILYLGYKLSVEEALKLGFISEIFTDKDINKIWSKLEQIASLSLPSIMGSKKLVRKWDQDTLLRVNEEEIKLLQETIMSDEFAESLMKYLINRRSKI